jgi:hypothetical protein
VASVLTDISQNDDVIIMKVTIAIIQVSNADLTAAVASCRVSAANEKHRKNTKMQYEYIQRIRSRPRSFVAFCNKIIFHGMFW